MVSVEDAVIARLTKAGKHFEMLVDSEQALEMKRGKPISIENVLAVRDIFRDARKGDRVQESELAEAFGTTDPLRIAREIVQKGEIQLTTEQRRAMTEEKRRQIADIISKQGVNPQTKAPHPANRIINAMEQARAEVDPFKSATEQVKGVLEKIRPILPISFEKVEVAIRVPMEFAGKASSQIRSMFELKKEEWKSDAWIGLIEIPAGMQSDVYEKVNSLTAGKAEVKVLSRSSD